MNMTALEILEALIKGVADGIDATVEHPGSSTSNRTLNGMLHHIRNAAILARNEILEDNAK
ncbi:hypothetical protein D3C85_631970 [compost metagenome]